MTLVLGFDPSLNSSGYAWSPTRTGVLRPTSSGIIRFRWIRDAAAALVGHLEPHGLELIVMEEPPYHIPKGQGWHSQAGGWWAAHDGLTSTGVPIVLVNVSKVKTYALGKGSGAGTDKPAMVAAVRQHFSYPGTDHNEADALTLSAMGYDHLNIPLAVMPATHRRALESVPWPVPPLTSLALARRALGG